MKHLIAIIFSAAAWLFLCIPAAGASEGFPFTYSVIDGQATITGFRGEPEFITIPPEIDGFPVTSVRDNAFYKCTSLRGIELPNSLTEIGHHSFYGCSSLEKIILPDSIFSIGMGCFGGCSSLRSAVLPDNLEILPDSCFRDCTALTEIMIPQSILEIEKFCFCGCTGLSGVSLGGHLNSIGCYAFFACTSLKDVYIPSSVDHIGSQAFGFDARGEEIVPAVSFSIMGKTGSGAEKYAAENSISFSGETETENAFSESKEDNSPVELPRIFVIAGLSFLILAIISAIRSGNPV